MVEPKDENASQPKFMRSLSPLPEEPMLLCADVGGTNTRLHLFKVPDTTTAVVPESCMVYQAKYANAHYESFTEVAMEFLKSAKRHHQGGARSPPYLGCFAVAGVVVDNKCNLVNLGWRMDGNEIAKDLKMKVIYLMNDFEAQGYGILTLDPTKDCDVLQEAPILPGAPIALLGAGTGLGQAFMTTGENGDYEVWPSEGGHKEFAPRQEGSQNVQSEMMKYLQIRFSAKSRISVERIVSGRGIANIYQFMAWKYPEKINRAQSSARVRGTLLRSAPHPLRHDPAVIVQAARNGTCELCLKTMDLFIGAYGSEAGVLALKFMPFGGDFIVGERGTPHHFIDSFRDKGRVSTMLMLGMHGETHTYCRGKMKVFLVRGEDMGERGVKLKDGRSSADPLGGHAHGMRTACAHMACARDETKRASQVEVRGGMPGKTSGTALAAPTYRGADRRVEATKRWLDSIVIGEKLCPFAAAVREEQKLRVLASEAKDAEMLAKEVATEAAILVEGLNGQEGAPETTLLVVDPQLTCCSTWQSFVQLSWTLQERAIHGQGFAELLQIVLFHPAAVHSVYAEGPPDAADFTIRSPFPTIHLLREADVMRAARRAQVATCQALAGSTDHILWWVPRGERIGACQGSELLTI
ncbi:unnamed protein product [Durusdinium trenchii]|uniref:Glucokinase n=1 Tax=Durusdinium trenchii TaxID=1381693 RepID=A0ABP0MHY2_9DINO